MQITSGDFIHTLLLTFHQFYKSIGVSLPCFFYQIVQRNTSFLIRGFSGFSFHLLDAQDMKKVSSCFKKFYSGGRGHGKIHLVHQRYCFPMKNGGFTAPVSFSKSVSSTENTLPHAPAIPKNSEAGYFQCFLPPSHHSIHHLLPTSRETEHS